MTYADLHAPSIFRGDPAFRGTSTTGKTMSQTTSDTISAAIKATGRSPGTLVNLSQAGNESAAQWTANRLGRRAAA